jgi:hypothetical protein
MKAEDIVNEVMNKVGITEKQRSQMPPMNTAYPEFILDRDGAVYHLQDLYKVNALPGKINEDGIIVPV